MFIAAQMFSPQYSCIKPRELLQVRRAGDADLRLDLLEPAFHAQFPRYPSKINMYRREYQFRERESQESQVKPRTVECHHYRIFLQSFREIVEIVAVKKQLIFSTIVQSNHRDGVKHGRETGGLNVEVNALIGEVGKNTPCLAEH